MGNQRRLGIGEGNASEKRSGSFSQRAASGKLEVVKETCKVCGHHKQFVGNSSVKGLFIVKCTKCKRESSEGLKL